MARFRNEGLGVKIVTRRRKRIFQRAPGAADYVARLGLWRTPARTLGSLDSDPPQGYGSAMNHASHGKPLPRLRRTEGQVGGVITTIEVHLDVIVRFSR